MPECPRKLLTFSHFPYQQWSWFHLSAPFFSDLYNVRSSAGGRLDISDIPHLQRRAFLSPNRWNDFRYPVYLDEKYLCVFLLIHKQNDWILLFIERRAVLGVLWFISGFLVCEGIEFLLTHRRVQMWLLEKTCCHY